jgi:dienelactone hydrolase
LPRAEAAEAGRIDVKSIPKFPAILTLLLVATLCRADERDEAWKTIAPYFEPPQKYANQYGDYRSPLLFDDGTRVKTPADWQTRRREILAYWHQAMGTWPALLEKPRIEFIESAKRENFTQHKIRVQISAKQMAEGYLLVPQSAGPLPAILVPFYEPETSTGQNKNRTRAFAYDLAKRGFVTLSIGSPGGDARKPDTGGAAAGGETLQPLSYLAYVAANCHTALASLPQVDPKRIGVVGHSYGGKWAMFASCLYEKFAAAAWSDPGIVFDESKPNVNYWEPWYLGLDPRFTHKPGLITPDNPRTGAYKALYESGHDLHELHALMAPRPFLVSGGSEDTPARWIALNHAIAVNKLLGQEHRVGMTNRPAHDPTEQSNETMYRFFEFFLKPPRRS